MLRFLTKFKKNKDSHLDEESSTPHVNISMTDAVFPDPITTATSEQSSMFSEAYECAKNNFQWDKVTSAISNHPEWLTRIPQGRRWTMLHQIVYCGNVPHLNEILAFEVSNEEFRLLCKSSDDKTVREVASERAHLYPDMLRCIERLVAIDQLLNNARDGKWELVKQFLRQQADIVNEKPPYRKYYLSHYLASTGQLDVFKELNDICEFRLDLIADNKTINLVAREHNHIEFARYIERIYPNINEQRETSISTTQPTSDSNLSNNTTTNQTYFSHALYEDPGVMIFALNPNSFSSMLLSPENSVLNIQSQDLTNNSHPITTASNNGNNTQENGKKSKVHVSPIMTDEEQIQYEKTITDNMKKLPADNFLSTAITCCITKAILLDPVVAADGFTYEREAIENWFEQSNRSPMTNQELENKELKPNHAIKSILQSLAEKTNKHKKSNGKM